MNTVYSDVPELAAQEQAILRRRKIAEQMMQQGQTPIETNRMAGGYVVPVSPLEGIAKLVQTYAGAKRAKDTDTEYSDLAKQRQQGVADALAEYQRTAQGAPAVTEQVTEEVIPARPGYVPSGEQFADRPNFNVAPGQLDAVTETVQKEVSPAVPGDPRAAVTQAMLSQYPELQRFAALEMSNMNRKEDLAVQQQFRSEESQLAREQRMQELQIRLQDQRLATADRLAMQKELAQMNNEVRMDIAQMTAANRTPAPLEPVIGPDGKPVLVSREDAIGKTPFKGDIGDIDKSKRKTDGAIAQAERIIGKVDQALGKVNEVTTGVGFATTPKKLESVTGAKDLASDLETIKANLGFAELQAMREASPTGGALGAIAVQELVALQSTVASLDQEQSPAQLKARLGEIKTHYETWKKAVEQSGNPNQILPTGAEMGGETPATTKVKKYNPATGKIE